MLDSIRGGGGVSRGFLRGGSGFGFWGLGFIDLLCIGAHPLHPVASAEISVASGLTCAFSG